MKAMNRKHTALVVGALLTAISVGVGLTLISQLNRMPERFTPASLQLKPMPPHSLKDAASALLNVLQRAGIPAEAVVVDAPYSGSLRIVLRSESTEQRLTSADVFNRTAVARAVIYLRRGFAGIGGYSTEVRNAKDELISFVTIFVDTAYVNAREFIDRDPGLSNQDAAAVARRLFRLDLEDTSLESLNVITDPFGYGNTQQMTLTVSVPDVSTANKAFPWVVGYAERLATELNDTHGATIAVVHAVITDPTKKALAAYVWDGELRMQSYIVSPGIDMLNQPAPTEAVATKQP